MNPNTYTRLLGARILSEANDLKRTAAALARDLDRPQDEVNAVLEGKAGVDGALGLIEDMGRVYPIDHSDLRLLEDDCDHGIRIMRAGDSESSSRIFERRDASGGTSPYYEYRDTAMSRLAPYRPEWIRELRHVDDADPENPDVVFNNGHFMHQYTLFVGPVNFYYGEDGNRRGSEMSTGDSFYITPFVPHTFTSRNPDDLAFILAVTFGARVRGGQKELYATGERALNWALRSRGRERSLALLDQHLDNAWLSRENLRALLTQRQTEVTTDSLEGGEGPFDEAECRALADCLDLSPRDLMIDTPDDDELVVIRRWNETDNRQAPGGLIHPMATTRHMPQMRGCVATVTAADPGSNSEMITGLHGWAYNFSEHPARLTWSEGGDTFEQTVAPGDSVYSQPFIPMRWSRAGDGDPRLCLIRIAGAIGLEGQREFSNMRDPARAVRETGCWFDDVSR